MSWSSGRDVESPQQRFVDLRPGANAVLKVGLCGFERREADRQVGRLDLVERVAVANAETGPFDPCAHAGRGQKTVNRTATVFCSHSFRGQQGLDIEQDHFIVISLIGFAR
jgi:hypothetical protein